MGTLGTGQYTHRLFGYVHVHEQYSNNISLKKWFAVVFPAFVLAEGRFARAWSYCTFGAISNC